ncbi:MAG: hypothetical protein R2743_07355 [Ilumatobacteraceae bacterium]
MSTDHHRDHHRDQHPDQHPDQRGEGDRDRPGTATPDPSGMDEVLQPIAGVGLELYAAIVRSIAVFEHDLSMLTSMAALHGVDHDTWERARRGWSARLAEHPAVDHLFRVLIDPGR